MQGAGELMNGLWAWTWRASLQGAVLVGLLLLLRPLLLRFLTPRWVSALWLLVLARLVLPWSPESSLSMFNWLPSPWKAQAARPAPVAATPVHASAAMQKANPDALAGAGMMGTNQTGPQPGGLALFWLGGGLAVLVFTVKQTATLLRRVQRERPVTDPQVLANFEHCRLVMGVGERIGLYASQSLPNPAVIGLWRPRLVVPARLLGSLDAEQLRGILLHELAHVRRHDVAIGWLAALVCAVHWFNPMMWLALGRMRADRELACDELAMTCMEPGESAVYGRTLISLLEQVSFPQQSVAAAGIFENHSDMKRRMLMITRFGKVRVLEGLAALMLFLAAACVSLTNAPRDEAGNFQVETTTNEKGWWVDKVDYPFVSDPQLIGQWETVDFVKEIKDFDPAKPRWKGPLFKDYSFHPDGKTGYPVLFWTKGLVLDKGGDQAAQRYVIQQINGQTYMFMEWKTGDYIIRHQKPQYYVLKKLSDKPGPAPRRIEDKIDLPFVNDPEVLGQWKSVDFVKEIKDYAPGQKRFKGSLFLDGMTFKENGKMGVKYETWTKGVVIHKGDKTASHYEIRNINGEPTMFYEWKSGDYVFLGMKPQYYVLKKAQ